MKRMLWMSVLILLVFLTACGYDAYDPALYGCYVGTTIDVAGNLIDMTEIYKGTNYIELAADGEGHLCLSSHVYEIEWGMNGEEITVILQGEESKGSLKNGVILLNYLDMDMDLRFEFDADYAATAPTATERGEAVTDTQKWWNGDWYGWWVIDYGTDGYAEFAGSWWDLCADVYIDEADFGTMTFWDEDGARDNPLGVVDVCIEDGIAVSDSGYFGAAAVGEEDWYIDPNAYGMENMLVIEGAYEDETGTFYYTAYLRPWGQDWEDAEQKPYYYETWYLPLVEAEKAMPDRIAGE